jgi:hypothetical protein
MAPSFAGQPVSEYGRGWANDRSFNMAFSATDLITCTAQETRTSYNDRFRRRLRGVEWLELWLMRGAASSKDVLTEVRSIIQHGWVATPRRQGWWRD